MDDLAVVLCTRNGAATLAPVLDAYAAQRTSGFSWRMVIVDNGSTDATPALICGYRSRLPITVVDEPLPGKSRALNRGLAGVEAALIVLTDDDAVPAPDFLQAWWEAAAHAPDHDLFGGRIEPDFPSPLPGWIRRSRSLRAVLFAECDMPEGPAEPIGIFGPNMAVRRRVLAAGFRFDETIGPNGADPLYAMGCESEFLARAAEAGYRGYFTRGPLVRHIVRPHQMQPAFWWSRAHRNGRGFARVVLAGRPRRGPRAVLRHAMLAALHGVLRLCWALCPHPPSRDKARWLCHWMEGFRREA